MYRHRLPISLCVLLLAGTLTRPVSFALAAPRTVCSEHPELAGRLVECERARRLPEKVSSKEARVLVDELLNEYCRVNYPEYSRFDGETCVPDRKKE